jgi:predicted DNA-binding protein (MmcQ/YjbR family)
MNIEEFREYCLAKKGASECFPFDEVTLVFKVLDKMFTLTSLDTNFTFNVKCDPEMAIQLRSIYPCVLPGYHMNKQQWNTIIVDGSVGDTLLKQWIDNSYDLIVEKMTRKQKQILSDL